MMSDNALTVPPPPALAVREISLDCLRAHGACEDQIDLFIATFGLDPVPITPDTIRRAAAAGLNVRWGAQYIFTPAARREYNRAIELARDEYDRAEPRLWKEFHCTVAIMQEEYARTIAEAQDECSRAAARAGFHRAVVVAREERTRRIAAADAEYNRACASALIRIIWGSDAPDA